MMDHHLIAVQEATVTDWLSKLVEWSLKEWLPANIDLREVFPELETGKFSMELFETKPDSLRPVGHEIGRGSRQHRQLAKWCGDLVLMVHDAVRRCNRALILEIKLGHVKIRPVQHHFFQFVSRYPEACYKNLKDAKVLIVNAYNIGFEKGKGATFEVRLEPYHDTLMNKKYCKKVGIGYWHELLEETL